MAGNGFEIQAYRTWIEISSKNLKKNYHTFRTIAKSRLMLGVIKSNAYGHGLLTMGTAFRDLGFDWLGVDSISEALRLRQEGIRTPILVMGYTQPENFALAAANDISLAISSFESLKALAHLKARLNVHIKIDTGMHRQGFQLPEVGKAIAQLKGFTRITVEGLFTHFAAAKDPRDPRDTHRQLTQFLLAKSLFRSAGFSPICHAAATGGTINFPESHLDMVRIGIGMYGYWPSDETKEVFDGTIGLQPVLTWKTIVSELKWVEKGERIGYDYTERLSRRTRVAVLPIGYWHGYWRAFSSKSSVLLKGKRCKVLGKVSMDMVTVDATDVRGLKVGDEAVLIGTQGRERIFADELGTLAGTSAYEILTRLNPLIKKQ